METKESIIRSARSSLAGTALSRVTGLLRDIAMAASFGSSAEIAAFMVAYRLANLFRRLLGEGNLQAGFVPHFVEQKENGPFFYRDALFSLGLVLLVAVGLLEGVLWGCSLWLPTDWREIAELSMWMVPGLFFICLYGLNSALLQCQKKYFLPAVAPIAFNLIWIFVVLFLPGVKSLSIAITIAFAGQWLMTAIPSFSILSLKEWIRPRLFSSSFKVLLKPLFMGILGVGAVQFNSALDAIFARMADLEGPAFLWYAIRIQQLPLALFGIALSGALLPSLSRTEDAGKRKELLQSALRSAGALMFACTFGIFALAQSGVNWLYGHGDFTAGDVMKTSGCLWAYGLGLVPSVFVLLLAAYSYAQKNYRLPMWASLISVAANIGFNALFVFGFGWGAISIAIATSFSSFLNMAILCRGVSLPWLFFLKMGTICAIAMGAAWGVQSLCFYELPRDFFTQALQFACLSSLYGLILGILAWKGNLVELFDLFRKRTVRPIS